MQKQIDLSRFSIGQNLDDATFKSEVYNKRIDLINIALEWKGCKTRNTFIIHNVWSYPADSSYKVCFGKYGKEYYEIKIAEHKGLPDEQIPDESRKNCNDMMPCVFKDGKIVDSFRARFDDIFMLLEICKQQGKLEVVKALSVLFFRNALLLDHKIVNGQYNYCPPKELVEYICSQITEYEGIPMEVYIHALDAIGFNEDVKYYTQGKLQEKKGIGRENNMKTYSYAASCVLGTDNWSSFIYKLMRSYGVSPISNKQFAQSIPELNTTYREPNTRGRRRNSEIITVEEIVDHF